MLSMRFTPCAAFLYIVSPIALAVSVDALRASDEEQLQKWTATYEREILPIIKERCSECHAGDEAEGDFDVDHFSSGAKVFEKSDLWESVADRIRLNEMPPEGSPELSDKQESSFHRWLASRPESDLCSKLASDATQKWYRGYVMNRRLTRTEYLHAIGDLVGVPIDPKFNLPSDGSGGEGFDTAGASLFTSAIHIERYLAVASQTIDDAIPESPPSGADDRSVRIRSARKRFLGHSPSGDASDTDAAMLIIRRFARRAWRRRIADDEVRRLLALFTIAKDRGGSFVVAVREPLKAILVSPNFLFVVEPESPQGGIQRLDQHQLATRLALLIWSSVPDEELLRRADEGKLDTDEQVIAETRRMLRDSKARSLGENFGLQWLGLTHLLSSVRPDRDVYPKYNLQLAADMREEAILLISRLFRENLSLLDLIDANEVFINGNLAQHYGLNLPADAGWQKFPTTDRRRGGVITLGAVLMATSYPGRTSPVLRGRWVLEELLGGRVPPPPPGVPSLEATVTAGPVSLRKRLEQHRENPACAACHNRMDPLGFGLENFDGLGSWRDTDAGLAIDASGKLPSGELFHGPAGLKQILLKRSSDFERRFVTKMLGFALGRELNEFDQCVIDDSMEQLVSSDHRASTIIETIVTSYPFQHRFFKAPTAADKPTDNSPDDIPIEP